MNASKLVFSDDGDTFKVISVDTQQDVLEIYIQSTTRSAACPNCCITSKRIHSYYTRKIADLPVFGKTSRISKRFESGMYRADTKELTVRNISRYQIRNSKKRADGDMGGTLEEVQVDREIPKDPIRITIPDNQPGPNIPISIPTYPTGGGTSTSTSGTNTPLQKLSKTDPCGNAKELNRRKQIAKILSKNKEMIALTGNGLEHGYNTYINLNNGNITGSTDIIEGNKTTTGQEVRVPEGWHWLANNEIEVTADYNHTHPFESAPSSIDVFDGIYPYIAVTSATSDALNLSQKALYLSYHSINVMTTNHDYAITITDPAKWEARYPNRDADYAKSLSMIESYINLGYDVHTAQELTLLALYGDMIQLYRSEKGANNFIPINAKVDPATFKKLISNINCN